MKSRIDQVPVDKQNQQYLFLCQSYKFGKISKENYMIKNDANSQQQIQLFSEAVNFNFFSEPTFQDFGQLSLSYKISSKSFKKSLQTCDKDYEELKERMTTFIKEKEIASATELAIQKQKKEYINEFKYVLQQSKIKGAFNKNTNVPKFIVRIFMQHFEEFIQEQYREDLIEHYKKLGQKFDYKRKNNSSISDVLFMLRSETSSAGKLRSINQRILSKIIQNNLYKEVVQKGKCSRKNYISYMIAAKIYNLRCRSKTLTERVKIF